MKVEQEPKGEIRITDDDGFILCKFYECKDGFLISYDKEKVTEQAINENILLKQGG